MIEKHLMTEKVFLADIKRSLSVSWRIMSVSWRFLSDYVADFVGFVARHGLTGYMPRG